MAKARSGLGRGLGSLLGGDPEGGLPSSQPAPPHPSPAKKKGNTAEVAAGRSAESEQEIAEDLNITTEENVTIKRVVERNRVATSASSKERQEPDFEVDIQLIEPNPDQPRTNFKKDELEELAESIKKNGLLSPILVREYEGKYQIIAGERRWQACKLIGMKTVPIRIKEADDEQTIILALIENIQRSNLNPIEEAYGYRRMMERGKMTQAEVAQAVSKGRTTITNALRLLELPEDAQKLLFEEQITAGHARAILSIPTEEGRRKLIAKLVDQNLSVREAENLARLLSGKVGKGKTTRPPAPKSFKTVAKALSTSLETDVKIKSVNGKNKIEIVFKDEEELQRLFKALSGE